MENITLGQIATALAFIVGIIGSVVYLKNKIIESLGTVINEKLIPLKNSIVELDKKMEENSLQAKKNNLESIKTDLINLMELADKGAISPEQKMRAHELYDYYREHGGNSYVHDKFERLKKEGKI